MCLVRCYGATVPTKMLQLRHEVTLVICQLCMPISCALWAAPLVLQLRHEVSLFNRIHHDQPGYG